MTGGVWNESTVASMPSTSSACISPAVDVVDSDDQELMQPQTFPYKMRSPRPLSPLLCSWSRIEVSKCVLVQSRQPDACVQGKPRVLPGVSGFFVLFQQSRAMMHTMPSFVDRSILPCLLHGGGRGNARSVVKSCPTQCGRSFPRLSSVTPLVIG